MNKLSTFTTAQEARDYSILEERMITASSMSVYLAEHGLYLFLKELYEGKMDTPVNYINELGEDVLDANGIPVVSHYTNHPAKEIVHLMFDSILSKNSDGNDFNLIQSSTKGQTVIYMFNQLITLVPEKTAELTALKDQCIAICNKVTYPYAEVTDEEWTASQFVPVEVEATYPSEQYLITTGNQGIDCEVTSDKDCNVTVYLAVCNDSGSQDIATNFIRYEQSVGRISIKNGKGILSLGSRKVRLYNKLFAIADNDAVITLVVKNNRG